MLSHTMNTPHRPRTNLASRRALEDKSESTSGVPGAIGFAARQLTNTDIASFKLALPDNGLDDSFGNEFTFAVSGWRIRASLCLCAQASAQRVEKRSESNEQFLLRQVHSVRMLQC
jgi:hypothetical protein